MIPAPFARPAIVTDLGKSAIGICVASVSINHFISSIITVPAVRVRRHPSHVAIIVRGRLRPLRRSHMVVSMVAPPLHRPCAEVEAVRFPPWRSTARRRCVTSAMIAAPRRMPTWRSRDRRDTRRRRKIRVSSTVRQSHQSRHRRQLERRQHRLKRRRRKRRWAALYKIFSENSVSKCN